jgi:type IV secretion system protein VirB3
MSGVRREELFLACTRPAMRWGVPMEGLYINLSAGTVFGMIMGSPVYWLVMIPVHYAMKFQSNKNPNFFREVRIWFSTKGANAGGVLWALPAHGPRSAEEYPTSI